MLASLPRLRNNEFLASRSPLVEAVTLPIRKVMDTAASRTALRPTTRQFTGWLRFLSSSRRRVERGKLSIDEPVGRYFPCLPNGKDVLVRHLLGHTSGIPGFTEVPDFDQLSRSRATPNEVATTIADRAPAFRAGDEWQYSNTNFVLLGRLIELIADAPYADVLQRELPLYSLARMDS
jgi:hypothetical protein